ncbi:FKBP-type peptidyl-prolyl cis-trans isomerase [Novosphingobium olei]|uniref:Peptidyl-prolyl cis-trans isomerase n=1 Tax=Novosphingobium olei TaxID=2728851 RepID=A0A7Y0GBP8_9SPHN|nr:FKBP-type peptidyl-prolyl cis-trans isomerase [Novosphingobium olei]NML95393.1 FKBP-type peptidyl-prolyl cis-trans isomerase [Novosphingobium olei]
MSEITRVPLQPVAKGSVTKIWLGVILAVVVAAALAFAARYHGLVVDTLKAGQGASPTTADVVLVNYVGRLANGKEFDRGEKAVMPVEGVIPGFAKGLQQMQRGGKYRLEIPASMAYGTNEQKSQATGEVVIPANSDLVFDVELLDFKSAAEIERQRQMIQQMQQQMGGQMPGQAPGQVPGAAAPGAPRP